METGTTAVSWSDSLVASTSSAFALFFSAVPRIIGFVLILAIGWFVASLLEKAIRGLLHAIRFDDMAQRAGFAGFVQKMGVKTDSSGFLALVAKWFIRLIVLVVAFDALGLPAVSDVLRQLLFWLPNLVVALVILIVGGLLAKAASGIVKGATAQAGFDNPDRLGKIVSAVVWIFAIVVAVNQIGIAQTLVNTLFMGVIGAAALAAALAFGLGARDTAGEIVRGWYGKSKAAAPKIAAASEAAGERMSPGSSEPR